MVQANAGFHQLKVSSSQGQRNPRRMKFSRPDRLVKTLLVIGLVLVVAGFANRQFRIVRLQGELERVEAEIRAMESRNAELQKENTYLQSKEFIEAQAREKLGLVMPGETVYEVAEPKDIPAPFDVPKRKTTSGSQSGY